MLDKQIRWVHRTKKCFLLPDHCYSRWYKLWNCSLHIVLFASHLMLSAPPRIPMQPYQRSTCYCSSHRGLPMVRELLSSYPGQASPAQMGVLRSALVMRMKRESKTMYAGFILFVSEPACPTPVSMHKIE